ncbi:MAG: hypothetical protein Q7K65_05520 [Candidatus Buchananbacteria bacterium]|nr:hypothetical protein [Candidatus Buchananbacteria bacterium]
MGFETPEAPTPREKFEKAEKDVHIEQVDLETQKKRRAEHVAEFKKTIKDSPFSILTIIDLLPTNLDVLLAKRRLNSAEKKVSGLIDADHGEATRLNQRYDELKNEVIETEKDFKEALQKLADFETDSLGMNDKIEAPEEAQ